jgi:endoribonuclease Dicer
MLVIRDAQNIKYQDSRMATPIDKVMRDFYSVTEPLSRPKIFAFADQPADHTFHFDSDLLQLELTLDAKVFGIPSEKRSEILALPDRPSEAVILYDSPIRITDTKLFKQLHQLDPSGSLFRRHFKAARYALIEVGACASDLVWRRALKEIEAGVSPSYEEEEESRVQSEGNATKRILDIIKNSVFPMPNLDSSSRGFNVTPKFARLVQILKGCQPYGESFRGIVFGQFLAHTV